MGISSNYVPKSSVPKHNMHSPKIRRKAPASTNHSQLAIKDKLVITEETKDPAPVKKPKAADKVKGPKNIQWFDP
jgi:hypothetical protein